MTGFENTAHDSLYDRPKRSLAAYGFNSANVCITAKETTRQNIACDVNFSLEETYFSAVRNLNFSYRRLIFLSLLFWGSTSPVFGSNSKYRDAVLQLHRFFQADWFNRIFLWFNRNFLPSNSIGRLWVPLLLVHQILKVSFLPCIYGGISYNLPRNESSHKFTGSSRWYVNWRLTIQVPHLVSLLCRHKAYSAQWSILISYFISRNKIDMNAFLSDCKMPLTNYKTVR